MTETPEDDRDLERRFAAERAHDARMVPAFAQSFVRADRVAHRPLLRPVMALGAVAVMVIAAGLWRRAPMTVSEAGFVVVPGEMRVPTDFLLDMVSTTVRAGEVPSIGAVDWYPLVPDAGAGQNATSRRN